MATRTHGSSAGWLYADLSAWSRHTRGVLCRLRTMEACVATRCCNLRRPTTKRLVQQQTQLTCGDPHRSSSTLHVIVEKPRPADHRGLVEGRSRLKMLLLRRGAPWALGVLMAPLWAIPSVPRRGRYNQWLKQKIGKITHLKKFP